MPIATLQYPSCSTTPQATEPPISHMAAAWLAHWRTEVHNQVPSVGGLCGHSSEKPNLLPCESIGYLGSQLKRIGRFPNNAGEDLGCDLFDQDRCTKSQAGKWGNPHFPSLPALPAFSGLDGNRQRFWCTRYHVRSMQRVPDPRARTWHASKTRVLITREALCAWRSAVRSLGRTAAIQLEPPRVFRNR